MPSLKELVDRYRAIAGTFGRPAPLLAFNLTQAQTEQLFTSFDEDYHISRFLHFSRGEGKPYVIDGEESTHVAIDSAIETIL